MSEYRNDIHSAHAKIDSLEREKRVLAEKLSVAERKKKVKCPQCKGSLYRMGVALFWGAAALVLIGPLVWMISLAVIHNNERGGCYVTGSNENMVFRLEREIPWNPDDTIGQYRSMDDALADAKKLNCEVL